MGFLRGLPGTRKVTLVKGEGTANERRLAIEGQVQGRQGFFPLNVPIEAGDVVEEPDPRPGMDVLRRSVERVEIFQGHGPLSHIEVTWGLPPKPAVAKPKALAIGEFHPRVSEVASALYADGHFAQAVFEAHKAVEVRIREASGTDESGTRLIGAVFGGESPICSLTKRKGKLGRDEHDGRRLMLLGAAQAVRNLGAHELEGIDGPSAIELLGLASQFMRWLDEI
jgi:uncharacterized protein (TIGR02391 family)